MATKTVQLVPLGTLPLSLIKDLEEPLLTQLGVTAVASKAALPTPVYAFNKDRDQYHCSAIIRRVTDAGVGSPTPAACDKTRFRCSAPRSAASIWIFASLPKPVFIP